MGEIKTCGMQAVARYTWPGKEEAYTCFTHGLVLLKDATALGFHLPMVRIETYDPDDLPLCSRKVMVRAGESSP